MIDLKWEDQPCFLKEGVYVFPNISLRMGFSCQIIYLGGFYYLSVGNLFGSQTVKSVSITVLGYIIEEISNIEAGKSIHLQDREDVTLILNKLP